MDKTVNIGAKFRGVVMLVLMTFFLSCEVQVIEVSEVEFLITKEWKVENVYYDDELILNGNPFLNGGRTENFRVSFNDDFTYDLINFDQSEFSGIWSLSSGSKQLTIAGYDLETWAVEVSTRSLKMNFISPANKPVYPVRMELEPVPGQ